MDFVHWCCPQLRSTWLLFPPCWDPACRGHTARLQFDDLSLYPLTWRARSCLVVTQDAELLANDGRCVSASWVHSLMLWLQTSLTSWDPGSLEGQLFSCPVFAVFFHGMLHTCACVCIFCSYCWRADLVLLWKPTRPVLLHLPVKESVAYINSQCHTQCHVWSSSKWLKVSFAVFLWWIYWWNIPLSFWLDTGSWFPWDQLFWTPWYVGPEICWLYCVICSRYRCHVKLHAYLGFFSIFFWTNSILGSCHILNWQSECLQVKSVWHPPPPSPPRFAV